MKFGRLAVVVGVGVWGSLTAGCAIDSVTYKPEAPTVPQLRLPRNDVYEGSVITGQLRPRFVWEPSTLSRGEITYELEYSPDGAFGENVETVQLSATEFQPADALPVSTTPPVGRRYYWRVRACAKTTCSDYSPTWWVNLGRSEKDFNGDGYADVVVGSHTNLQNSQLQGRAYVYFGGPGATFHYEHDGLLTNLSTESWFGYAVSTAGDVNGDGFADILVGAPKEGLRGALSGSAYLYLGRAGNVFNVRPDLVIAGEAAMGLTGFSVASAGDLNMDGYSDMLISSPYAGKGVVEIYYGGPVLDAVPDGTLSGDPAEEKFGLMVATAGDVNGDGYSDAIVNVSGYGGGSAQMSCVSYLYFGRPGTLDGAPRDQEIKGLSNERCNIMAQTAGDVNGDGFSDVVARVHDQLEGGRVYLGTPKGIGQIDTSYNLASGHSSRQASPLGDVNGDGADDIGLVDVVNGNATAVVYLGRLGATSEVLVGAPAAVLNQGTGTAPGYVMRRAGDLNGDGYEDFVIADPSYSESSGRVDVYFGNAGGSLDPAPDGQLSSPLGRLTYFGESAD
ncbi:MAG: FG-GAP-like repeat-containing protein [Kofleriaceae bacterium]